MLKTMLNKSMRRSRRGLILLLALGMLALFSLLAVTYIVAASNSRAGAQAMRVRANASNTTTLGLGEQIIKQSLRGTRDQQSAFYQHAILEDVYDSRATQVRFGHRTQPIMFSGGDFRNNWCVRLTPVGGAPNVAEIVKVSLDPRNPKLLGGNPSTYRLNALENAYNTRVLTVTEGPLAGYSFRILKYVGYVNDGSYPDPNYPSNPNYTQANAYDYDYSIAIDLSEVIGILEGRWVNPSTGKIEPFSGSAQQWISLPNGQGLRNLFYFYDPGANNFEGYRCVINGAAFSNAGIGMEDDSVTAGVTGYANLDATRWISIITPQGKVPAALLPHYDYLQSSRVMVNNGSSIGVESIGDENYVPGLPRLRGQSNEGYDVPDWRDFWLAHQDRIRINPTTVVPYITPSFHRPELVNYLAHLYGPASGIAASDIDNLLALIDASSARVLSYTSPNGILMNPGFRPSQDYVQMQSPADLVNFVRAQIEGPWDVDNDGDGVPESVWINPNLPTMYAPDGRMLKPLAAIHIEDLDGRINLNLHGDRIQGQAASFNAFADTAGFLRANLTGPIGLNIPQGLGYGPADISLNQLFLFEPQMLASSVSNYSIFDERYGAKRHHESNNPVDLANMDRSPGKVGNDFVSELREREIHRLDPALGSTNFIHGQLPGMPMGRRSAVAPAFDRNGNLSFVHPSVPDARPTQPALPPSIASELVDDPYETSTASRASGDTPFTVAELERILRRFDDDVLALPEHIREHLEDFAGYDNLSEINRVITTRSAELRLPKIAAAASVPTASGAVLEKDAGNFLGFIRLVHEQRYRRRSFPANPANDEPQLNMESLYQLFPPEFASNLRMDINRAFGNGRDDNNDGNVDDPFELSLPVATNAEREWGYNDVATIPSNKSGFYRNRQRELGSISRPYLGSRQLLARYLYCLGQLMIPREYEFPSMRGETLNSLKWYHLRARSIAQWAVNVVDFRDADVAMTRFEYDVFPFGVKESSFGDPKYNPKEAFWAPDVAPVDRDFVGVVWGMEMPELLLTESLAFHDKRVRDTDIDDGPGKATNDPTTPDPDLDQYRFPEGSLFLELYAPRTTYVPEDNRIAGTSSSLYDVQTGLPVKLDLGRLAPPAPDWGRQPVWRIGINPSTPPGTLDASLQPNALYQQAATNNDIYQRDFQAAKSTVLAGNSSSSVPEQRVGSGLFDDLDQLIEPTPNTVSFERMIWFTNTSAGSLPRVPDLAGNNPANDVNPNRQHQVYYNRNPGPTLLEGGHYAVVGPRRETSIGALQNNPETGVAWLPRLLKSQLMANTNRPVRSQSHQTISLDAGNVSTTLLTGVDIFRYRTEWSGVPKSAVGIVCAADIPDTGWSAPFPQGIGINISIPNPIANTGYWRDPNKPLERLNDNDLFASRADERYGYGDIDITPDSWVDCTGATPVGNFPDKPFDYDSTTNDVLTPASGSAMNQTGTYPNVRTAFLQRLADPNMAYDPVNNPYITVDWISLDLTVFNGEAPKSDDPQDGGSSTIAFQSRYKDGATRANANSKATIATPGQPTLPGSPKVTQGGNGVWGYSYHSYSTAQLHETTPQTFVPLNPPATGPGAQRYPSYFMHQLGYASQQPADGGASQPKHQSATSLGYANVGHRFNNISGTASDDADDFDGFGPPQQVLSPGGLYNGAPRDLTSLVWYNRPFAPPAELMMVPLTSPGQLGLFHSIADQNKLRTPFEYLPSFGINNALVTNLTNAPASDWSDYTPNPDTPAVRNRVLAEGYWLKRPGTWPTMATRPTVQADWSSLLEFIETKPPFIDSAKFLQPDAMVNAIVDPMTGVENLIAGRFLASYIPDNFTGQGEPETVRGPSLVAPTNEIPNYTSAGKINLNTLTLAQSGRSEALQALEYLYLVGGQRTGATRDVLTDQFFRTRRGFNGGASSNFFATSSPPSMDPNYPSQFMGSYRSGLASNIQPIAPFPGANATNRDPLFQQRGRYPVESGILRSYTPNQTPNSMVNTNSFGSMLFTPDPVARIEDSSIPAVTATEIEDAQRNAFTRHQRAMRLPNLVTDQSNVFAVWVTVGLFEYDPINGFGREYVNASGEEQRERSFYIIDRTVPVGFIPGEDLNTEKTILLRRKISGDR
ncbi:MAG: hypothetical protein ACK5AC_03825 [Planctomycetota bacterium]